MASLMDIDRLSELLRAGRRRGCRLVWVESDRLLLGADVREPRFAVDFAREALVPAGNSAGDAPLPKDAAPSVPAWLDEIAGRSGRRTGHFALLMEGQMFPAKSQRDLLLVGLQAIERTRPGTLEKLAADTGRTKRVVARDRASLYANASLAKHAEEIEGGWWVATNNSYPEVEKFIRRAALHAGLPVELRRSP